MNVFDASALLCLVKGEPGADTVRRELENGGSCSAANWSEVAQKILSRRRDWWTQRSILNGFGVKVVPVTIADAERAAELWQPGAGLSLADRICLATAERLDAIVWTADTAWGSTDRIRQIR